MDEDSIPNPATTQTHSVTVAVDPASISAGGPYAILEGGALNLAALVVGTPTSIGWDLNNDQNFTDATGLTPATVSWSTLQSLGINNSGADLPVSVRVSYANGQNVVVSSLLDISNVAPVAQFGNNAPLSGFDEGAVLGTAQVAFTGQGDPAAGDVAAGFTYSFDFGNTGIFDIENQAASFANVPAALLGDSGVVTVRGRITDQDGGFSEHLTSFEVNEVLPAFALDGPLSIAEGYLYQLSLTGLYDPGIGDSLTSIDVDWGDGTPLKSYAPSTTTFLHRYADNQAGQTIIRVIATDSDGSVEVERLVSVANVAPSLFDLTADLAAGSGLIFEGDEIRFSGSITDPGVLDTFTLTIDWGDGQDETIPLGNGVSGFSVGHVYVNDGQFAVSVTLSDDDGDTATGSVNVSVNNAAPQVTAWLAADEIVETGMATVSGIVSDPGLLDAHAVTIDWQDGSLPQVATLTNGTFTVSHTYADDAPTATSVDLYNISISVVDLADQNSQASTAVNLLVSNVAPQITSSGTDAYDLAHSILPGQSATLTIDFVEVGTKDSHTATIDWGDGTIERDVVATFDPVTGLRSITESYVYAADGMYVIEVTVIDDDSGVSNVGSAVAVVATPGVNKSPAVSNQTFTVDENSGSGTPVGLVVAADPDLNDTLTFALDDNSVFLIDSSSGQVTVADSVVLDYEYQSTYAVQVTVSDALGANATATLTIDLNDVNEFAPRLGSADFILNPSALNGTVFGTLTATDDDGNDRLLFSLEAGSPFAVDEVTGKLRVVDSSLLDFSTSPRMLVRATVTDQGGLTDTGFVVVTADLTGQSGAPTVDDQLLSVFENETGVGQVIASDPDLPAETLTFSLTGNGADDDRFAVSSSGLLSFLVAPDYENPVDQGGSVGDNVYQVEVQVEGSFGATATATVRIRVDPVNEHAPVFTSPTSVSISENATFVQTLAASDADQPTQTITYLINGSELDNGKFEIISGELRFKTAPDFETPTDVGGTAGDNAYEVSVIADDGQGRSTSQKIVVTVGDVDEVAPTADIVDVTPDPRTTPVGVVTINFSEAVTGVDISDFTLTRDGNSVNLGGLTVEAVTPSQYTINLSTVTGVSGDYVLTLNAAGSEITDSAGNSMTADATEMFAVTGGSDTVAPLVDSVQYEGGTAQRSIIRSITITFDSEVTIDDGAFQVIAADGTLVTLSSDVGLENGQTVVVLTFSGSKVDTSGSLIDGNYSFRVLDSKIRDLAGNALDGDADGTAGTDYVDEFFRLFGDIDGDRDVDSSDYLSFRRTYGRQLTDPLFNMVFDYDNDGDVDASDYLQFRRRYGIRLNP